MDKVLVVDDDVQYLEMMQDLLKDAGYDVQTCPDPLKAIDCLTAHSARCVLLDFHMPGLDGEDLLHLIHSKHPEIPVIICSGHLEAEENYLIHEGAFEILAKPFDHQALCEVLNRALEKGHEVTPVVVEGLDLRAARDTVMRKVIIKALSKADFNVTQAAKLLGISRQYLIRYLKFYQIHP